MDTTELDQTIRNLAATVRSNVDDRLHHPSYGVTKRETLVSLIRLEGALLARAAVLGDLPKHYEQGVRAQAEALDIPLENLRRAVAGC